MTDQSSLPVSTLPDGGAEIHVVLRLRWDDVAALGREAGRLAAQWQRPVTLDEAASNKLSTRRTSSASATPSKDRVEAGTTASRMALASAPPAEPARERTYGASVPAPLTARTSTGTSAEPRGPFDPATRVSSLASAAPEKGRATG